MSTSSDGSLLREQAPKWIQDLLGTGELIETHISWVIRKQDRVYKVKKPVDFGFLDFTTVAKRHAACQAEVELNRRLAPKVYRGVVPITRDVAGHHRVGGSGQPVDFAVEMIRVDDGNRCDSRLSTNSLTKRHMQLLAVCLAQFHKEGRCDEETSSFGRISAIKANLQENFQQTREMIAQHITLHQAREIEAYQLRFLREHAEAFETRIRLKKVRDGHGDLRLEHIYFADGDDMPVILDCIEFCDRFRFADVCADIAFVYMDLVWHGRVDLAEIFLAAYARETDDYGLYRLVDFYASYRAYVRAKICGFVAADAGISARLRDKARDHARRYFLLSIATERCSPVLPAVVAVGGVIAAGKSTVSDAIAEEMAAPVVSTDRTRKHMAGVSVTENIAAGSWSGYYSQEFTKGVYEEVYRRARSVLSSGRPVVLDASFQSRTLRAGVLALADAYDVPCYFVECRVDPAIAKNRLAKRAEQGSSVSDGRLALFDEFVSRWQSMDEIPEERHFVLDTSLPLTQNMQRLRSKLPVWPQGLNA